MKASFSMPVIHLFPPLHTKFLRLFPQGFYGSFHKASTALSPQDGQPITIKILRTNYLRQTPWRPTMHMHQIIMMTGPLVSYSVKSCRKISSATTVFPNSIKLNSNLDQIKACRLTNHIEWHQAQCLTQ